MFYTSFFAIMIIVGDNMKRINFNIKDRKTLTLGLCLILVCVFTLTVAYSALSAVLTISGNARVSAADWDIYLNNPRVTQGSATTNVPVIKTSSTLEFETTLNMPGDFYEFTVDVVNGGDIDAMIENVVKTPDLTAEQAKFLNYVITYQNGESITTKQTLSKGTTMPIKVRIEYREDLVASDLPTGQVVLDLSLTLEYVQSDGTGSSVKDNGEVKLINVISGDGTQKSDEVCIGEECFYVMYSDDTTVTMLAKYNLYVGGKYNSSWTAYGEEATGKQDSTMIGYGTTPRNGTTAFSNTNYWSSTVSSYPAYVYDSNSILYSYVENYKTYLSTLGVTPGEARLITYDELINLGCIEDDNTCGSAPSWVYATSYWSGSALNSSYVWRVQSVGGFDRYKYSGINSYGCRPVITISRSLI